MAYNIGYTGTFPSLSTSSIGYSVTTSNTVTNIPTASGTVNVTSLSNIPEAGVWLVIANLTITGSTAGNNYYRLSLSTTKDVFDPNFCNGWITNMSSNTEVTLQVMRPFYISTASATNSVNLVLQTSAGAANSSGTFTIQYTRLT